jgi:hypothetical protein
MYPLSLATIKASTYQYEYNLLTMLYDFCNIKQLKCHFIWVTNQDGLLQCSCVLPHRFYYWTFPDSKSQTLISHLRLPPTNRTMLYYMLAAHLFHQRQHTILHVWYAIVQLSLWPQTLHYITLHYTKHMLSQTQQTKCDILISLSHT